MKQAEQGNLRVIPIFFNVTPKDVGSPYGSFGCKVYVESQHNPSSLPIWTKALKSAAGNIGLLLKNYSQKKHIEFLLQNRRRIKKGSKIVITTRDKSSIAEFSPEIYVVPPLNDTVAWQLFNDHAFKGGASSTKGNFPS
ncbi:unnamed protein product [Brassica napus]|uniref:(rape) hypothetical protein n=1 Tax=Brassica napus TaxID=3708 RepID=A0A816M5M2_BRANA|nr:unnamed protein product [Brassica napus]